VTIQRPSVASRFPALSSTSGANKRNPRRDSCPQTLHPAIRRVCRLIQEKPAEPWQRDRAALLIHLNASHFSELFHGETGLPFGAYVEKTRIGHAKNLLVSSRMPITEIAETVGYRDLGTFERAFRRQVGACPRKFRSTQWRIGADELPTNQPNAETFR
jgi:transcriptional regulator GlxA family with amidase domain